jgi:N6-L-threonylcarbamoyladenine synthase
MKDSENFSFSGLKTAVINYIHNKEQKGEKICKEDVAASFEKEIFEDLLRKTVEICNEKKIKKLAIAGGVAANSYLKNIAINLTIKNNIELFMPQMAYCTDNAAMIGSAAYYLVKAGKGLSDLSLTGKAVVSL